MVRLCQARRLRAIQAAMGINMYDDDYCIVSLRIIKEYPYYAIIGMFNQSMDRWLRDTVGSSEYTLDHAYQRGYRDYFNICAFKRKEDLTLFKLTWL